jgi:cell wall-associated NlpC family hydrolase
VPITFRTGVAAVASSLALLAPASIAAAEPRSVDRRLAAATQQLEVVVERYNGLREELKRSSRETEALRARIAPLTAEARRRDAEVGALAAAAYRSGRGNAMVSLLDAGTPDELGGRLALLEHLGRGRNRALTALTEATASLDSARATLAAVTARQRVQGAQLSAQKVKIEAEIVRLNAMRGGPGLDGPPPSAVVLPQLPAGAASKAVRFAYAQLGKPYEWGGSGPSGYDCSGLTSSAWRAAGISLPHNARAQYGAVAHISRGALRPGDLVFYYGDIHHVALFVGDGKIIHAPQQGERIRFDRFDYQPIHGYGRPYA